MSKLRPQSLVSVTLLALTGCHAPRATTTSLIELNDSLDPLRTQFNDNRDRLRIVALLSPTCNGCIYAARGVAKSVLADHPRQPLDVYVVWMPMVGDDSFAAATRASKIFRDQRVYQFYDENRLCGLAYAEQVFPHAYDDADRTLPPDHRLRKQFADIRELPREQRAFWDMVFFYPPSPSPEAEHRGVTEWTDRPPTPTHWLKQTTFSPSRFSDPSYLLTSHLNFRSASRPRRIGLFWRDSFANPPFESDWFDALREVMKIVCPKG